MASAKGTPVGKAVPPADFVAPAGAEDDANTQAASPEQQALIDAGATPVQPDVNALLAQFEEQRQKMQQQIDQLLAERGIPSDPTAAAVQNVSDHAKAQAQANPVHADDYAEVLELLGDLDSESVTADQVSELREALDELSAKHPQHELGYLKSLAKDLHKLVRSSK